MATTSIDALIQATKTGAVSLDSQVAGSTSGSVSIDAIVEYTYYEMWDYLSTVTADNDVTLDVKPSNTLVEEGSKSVTIHLGEDGSEERIAHSDDSTFIVSLQWEPVSETNSETIMDFFHSPFKGCGMLSSFKWVHYGENSDRRHTYVVRFASDLSKSVRRGYIYGITNVKLEVLGRA